MRRRARFRQVGRAAARAEIGRVGRRRQVRRGDRELSLTSAEFRLLSALVAAHGRVLSRQQLQDALYQESVGAALDRTIDVHIGGLCAKLGDDPKRPRYVATVRGSGYRAAER